MADQFITPAQLRTRFDFRVLGDLVVDDNTRITDTAVFDANAVVLACIEDASGLIKAAVQAGGQYTTAQVAELVAAADPLLLTLTATETVRLLYRRRSGSMPPAIQDASDRATDTIDDLRKGKAVFDLDSARAADSPEGYRPSESESDRIWPITNNPMFPRFDRTVS